MCYFLYYYFFIHFNNFRFNPYRTFKRAFVNNFHNLHHNISNYQFYILKTEILPLLQLHKEITLTIFNSTMGFYTILRYSFIFCIIFVPI